jgi:methylaspartate ammonia-lyase
VPLTIAHEQARRGCAPGFFRDARAKGTGCCLGGSGNETDHSARITAQIGLACQPNFLLSKPGFGGDEALMIQTCFAPRADRDLAPR